MTLFQKASQKDIALIRDLAEQSWKSAYKNILSPEQMEYMLTNMYSVKVLSDQITSTKYFYYLIINEGKPAGFIGFEIDYEPETTKLHRLYFLPETIGKGLGAKALAFLHGKVWIKGNTRIILNVNKSNKAKNFYYSQGYKLYDEGVFDIGNGFVMDDFLLEYIF